MQTTIAKNLATWATSAPANYGLTRRDLAPPGRAPDCLPQGGTPAPARPFLTAPRARIVLSLSISAISATLMCTIVFVTVFFSSLLGRSWRVLSPVDRLLGSLGLLLGLPGALLAAAWSLLRRSWGGLGATWAPLGSSWGGHGATWAPLGSSWSHPKQHPKIMLKQTNFKSPKRTCHPTWRGGFWRPNPTKIGSKTSPILRGFSRTKKLLFKTFLGTSWVDLGAFWRSSWDPNLRSGSSGRSIS